MGHSEIDENRLEVTCVDVKNHCKILGIFFVFLFASLVSLISGLKSSEQAWRQLLPWLHGVFRDIFDRFYERYRRHSTIKVREFLCMEKVPISLAAATFAPWKLLKAKKKFSRIFELEFSSQTLKNVEKIINFLQK